MNDQFARSLRRLRRSLAAPKTVRTTTPLSLVRLEGREVPAAVTVSGRANIYGAGFAATAAPPSPGGGGGGVLPPAISLAALGNPVRVEFPSVTGTVSGFAAQGGYNGPDGGGNWGGKTVVPSWKGISGVRHNTSTMYLTGVFLAASAQPATAPAAPNLTTANTQTSVAPLLGQQFFVGDGKTNTGAPQFVTVPDGAATLYLGFAECLGFGGNKQPGYYNDNGGKLAVTVEAAPFATTTAGGADVSVPYAPGEQTVTLSATVNGPGGPATGGVVTFTLFDGTTAVGTATPGPLTNGTATASYIIPAGTAPGTYTVQAVYGGTATFAASTATNSPTVTIVPGPLAQLVVDGGDQTAEVGTDFATAVTVRATDQFANGIAGVSVTVSGPANGAGATFSVPAVTGADGMTSFTAAANTTAGVYTVTVLSGGVTQTFTLTNTAGPAATVTVAAGGGQTVTAGGTFGDVTVAVVDAFGNPVGGTAVTLTAPAAIGLPSSAATDADGTATVTPLAAGPAGAFTLTLTVGTVSADVALTVTAGPPAELVLFAGGGQSVVAGAGFAQAIQVVVVDAYDNPLPGLSVSVSGPATGAGATFSNPGATDAQGFVSFAATANAAAGTYPVVVTSGPLTLTFQLTNLSPLAGVTLVSGDGQTVEVNSAAGVPIVFTVLNAAGGPADPTAVTFTLPATGPSATLGPITATGVPGQGRVTLTANGVAGAYTILVTAGSATVPLTVTNTTVPVVPPPPPPPVVPPVALYGTAEFAIGTDVGLGTAALYEKTGEQKFAVEPFPGFTGGVRVAAADVTGDGVADLIAGTGPGAATRVRVFDGVTKAELFSVDPFEAAFTGGVYVTAGDLDGDGTPDLVITPDEGGGPRVDIYSGRGFAKFASFFGIDDPNFRGGARAATGDLNADGRADLVVVAGFGGGPRVAGFDGITVPSNAPARLFGDFFAFEQALRNGIFVTVGDLDGDGFADLIAGGGPGGGPRVTAFGGAALLRNEYDVKANFFAGDTESRGGVRLTAKDLDGDAVADLVVGAGTGAGSRATGYAGQGIAPAGAPAEAFAFDAFPGFAGGVFVG